MSEPVFLIALLSVVGGAAFTITNVVRLWTSRRNLPAPELTERIEALERGLEALQKEQSETQERLDFTERMLSREREQRKLGG